MPVSSSASTYGKSLEYHRKALSIYERVYGPRHPGTASSHYNMGAVFLMQGDHAGALEAYGKALAIYEQVFGPQSEPVASTIEDMATTLKDQGNREQAREYQERSVVAYTAALGPEHPRTKNARKWAHRYS